MNDEPNTENGQPAFPDDLNAAIQRAQSQRATPLMVASLIEKAISLDDSQEKPPRRLFTTIPFTGSRFQGWMQATGIAVSLATIVISGAYFAVWLSVRDTQHSARDTQHHDFVSGANLSPITRVSLVQFTYKPIDDDLERLTEQAEEVSSEINLAALRYEIQTTLDTYYDWSNLE